MAAGIGSIPPATLDWMSRRQRMDGGWQSLRYLSSLRGSTLLVLKAVGLYLEETHSYHLIKLLLITVPPYCALLFSCHPVWTLFSFCPTLLCGCAESNKQIQTQWFMVKLFSNQQRNLCIVHHTVAPPQFRRLVIISLAWRWTRLSGEVSKMLPLASDVVMIMV